MHDVAVAAFADAKNPAPVQSSAARLGLVALEVPSRDVLDRRRRRLLHAEIDPLAFGTRIASQQREHHSDRAEVRRRMISLQTERTHRRVIREAVDVEHATERSTSAGFSRCSPSQLSPSRSRVPGAKLSITTSALRASCKKMSAPREWFRSSVSDRLFRL